VVRLIRDLGPAVARDFGEQSVYHRSLRVVRGDLSELFKGGAGAWSFVPQVVLPIFDGGRNKANLEASEITREISLAEYERSIQGAFREVADTLAQRGTLGEQLAAQQSLVEATTDTHRLSQVRFDQGLESYLEVLDAQRSMYASQQDLITVRLARLANQMTVYKVLGGGWSVRDDGRVRHAGGPEPAMSRHCDSRLNLPESGHRLGSRICSTAESLRPMLSQPSTPTLRQ
jgi:Outer membrane efflux protein